MPFLAQNTFIFLLIHSLPRSEVIHSIGPVSCNIILRFSKTSSADFVFNKRTQTFLLKQSKIKNIESVFQFSKKITSLNFQKYYLLQPTRICIHHCLHLFYWFQWDLLEPFVLISGYSKDYVLEAYIQSELCMSYFLQESFLLLEQENHVLLTFSL